MAVGMLTCLYEIVRKQIRIWDFNKIASRAESPVVEPRTGSDLYPLKDKRSWRGCLSTLLRGSCQGGWGTTAAPAWTALKQKHF